MHGFKEHALVWAFAAVLFWVTAWAFNAFEPTVRILVGACAFGLFTLILFKGTLKS